MTDLLTALRSRNVLRCQSDFHHDIESWSVLEWAGAMSGEAGEATNLAKKITRGDFALTDVFTKKGVTQSAAKHLADEVADTIIYADLLLARVGESVAEAIVRKFNATSDERGSDIKFSRVPVACGCACHFGQGEFCACSPDECDPVAPSRGNAHEAASFAAANANDEPSSETVHLKDGPRIEDSKSWHGGSGMRRRTPSSDSPGTTPASLEEPTTTKESHR